MFTGLVETRGTLVRRTIEGKDARLVLRAELGGEPIELGESIAIDGVCLTVDTIATPGRPGIPYVLEFDASSETLAKTTLGELETGASVNLERAVRLGARMGGHIVTGHVDGKGRVVESTPLAGAPADASGNLREAQNPDGVGRGAKPRSRTGARKVVFEAPAELARYIAPKGSICVSGVSLTVNGVAGRRFDVVLIPHTQEKTSLDLLSAGAHVNLEVDLLARYVARLLDGGAAGTGDDTMLERLKNSGYL